MKNPTTKHKRTAKCISVIYNSVDSHKWASKIEIQHLISSKPALNVLGKLGQHRFCIN